MKKQQHHALSPYGYLARPALDRFEEKFIPEPMSGCWLWEAGLLHPELGYGGFYLSGRMGPAHRASWTLYRGEIPDDLFVLHRCDNPYCVNPDHLFLGTQADNMKDCAAKGRLRFQRPGIKRHRQKLTKEIGDKIRAEYVPNTRGKGPVVLGRKYGISPQSVQAIISGRSYR